MTAAELVAKVDNLPPVSSAALGLVNLLDQPGVGNEDLVHVIRCDSVLTAKLLRACNSSYFSFSEPVTSVDQAVLMLGHQQVLHVVLNLALGGSMNSPLPGYAVEANELWRHSLTAAMAAEVIANSGLDVNAAPETAFTAGLLHDFGKLAMNQVLTPEVQEEIRGRIKEGVARVEAERTILGTDHGEVGAFLLNSWKLPEEIVEAVANHHQPVLKPRPRLSAVAHLADCLAHLAGSSPGWEAFAIRVDPEVIRQLGFTPERLESMVITVRDATENIDQFITLK
jgi:putative nucleotidyltransferase with HDIG domain